MTTTDLAPERPPPLPEAPAPPAPVVAHAQRIRDVVRAMAPAAPASLGRALEKLFDAMEPGGTLVHRIEWLEDFVAFLRGGGSFELPAHATVSGRSSAARLWIVVEVLRASPAWRHALARLWLGILHETSALQLFARAGLPAEHRFFSEFVDRLARSLLPTPPDDGDLAKVLLRMFKGSAAIDWLEELPPALVVDFFGVLVAGDPGWQADVRGEAVNAVALIAVRAAQMGLDDDVRARSDAHDPLASPFLTLARLGVSRASASDPAWAETVEECHAALDDVHEHLENAGISVDLVFRVEYTSRMLDRLSRLLPVARGDVTPLEGALLFRALLREAVEDTRLGALLQTNIQLLARRIIERAGETGEHYITETRAEYHNMVTSAGGGGALTALTTVLKFLIGGAHLPPFIEGVASSVNYSLSFLAMQALGFTLATKQPAMTAATIAASVDEGEKQGNHERLVDLIARTSRSQLAAAIGNIGVVIPAALVVHFAWLFAFGAPLLTPEKAHKVVESLSPLRGGALFHAAFTGVLLWTSSIAAGWLDNWFVYRRLPEAFAAHRGLRRLLGPERATRIARLVQRQIAGIGGAVSLGILLGMVPIFAAFFGLPLDVRHVTLSTGGLVFAGCALGPYEAARQPFVEAVIGIACIGTLNFGVSFALALFVALRARAVNARGLLRLAWAVVKRFVRRPLSFLRPPR